jgi:hypothetical protein
MKIICEKLWLNYKRFRKRIRDWWDVTTAVETPKNWKYKSRNT